MKDNIDDRKLELLFAKPIMIFNDLLNEDDYNYAHTWLKEHS